MTTSPVLSVTDELLAELEEAASKATPQHLDSADDVIRADSGAMIECHVCGGEGYASLENDYCNFDNHAIGVQFYGIGPEFGAAEEYYRRANPATITALTAELRRLRAENAELAKDAGRYRWLRDGAGYCDTRDIPGMAPRRMDEYIDTAMERPQ